MGGGVGWGKVEGERYANKGVRSTAYQKKLLLKDGGTLRTLGSSLEGRWHLKDLGVGFRLPDPF